MISDRQFFEEELNLQLPGMEHVREAVEKQDMEGAAAHYAGYVRAHLQPERFFSIPYEPGENLYTLPGETEKEAAERICCLRLVSCGIPHQFQEKVDWYFNPTENKYEEWPWQLNRHHEFKHLAHIYQETGDERYAACCAELFESWYHQALWPEHLKEGVTSCFRTIECGIRMGASWGYPLHVFYKSPHFTDRVLTDWAKSVCEHGHILRERHKLEGNWLLMEMNGLAHLSVFFPEFTNALNWREYAVQKMVEELEKQLYPDGFQYELTTGYHNVVLINYGRLMRLFHAFGIPVPESFQNLLERGAEVFAALMQPDGRVPNVNDGTHQYASVLLQQTIDLFPGNPVLQWVVSKGKEGSAPAYLSKALPYSGIMVMRSGWGKDALWGMLDAGPFGRAHQHEDKLSFLLYANGRLILTEGGNYAYDSSEMRKYVLSTRAHNTVRVDGMDQNRLKNYSWEKEEINKLSGMEWKITEEYDAAQGSYREGYGAEADCDAVHERCVIFLKKPKHGLQPFFVVVDRMRAGREHTYETLWHLDCGKLVREEKRTLADGLCVLCSEAIEKSVAVYGQEVPEWQGWAADSAVQGDYRKVHTLQHFSRGKDVRAVTVLYPAGEEAADAGVAPENGKGVFKAPGILAVEASRDVSGRKILLHLENGEVWTLDENDYIM